MAYSTTSSSPEGWTPGLTYHKAEEVLTESLALTTSTISGAVEGDAAAVTVCWAGDGEANIVAEGAEIDQDPAPLNDVTFLTSKAAVLFRVSRELMSQPNVSAQLAASASRGLTSKLDRDYLAAVAPTSPATTPVAGLLNQTGIVAGDEVTGSLDALVDLLAELESNGATPSHIIVDPLGYAALAKIRRGTGSNESLLGAGVDTPELRLLSVPVLKSNAMTAYSGLVLSASDIVSAVGQIAVATSEDAFFSSDSVGVRATLRYGWTLPIANRVGKFTIDDGEE